jgi:hypothetical protein
MESLCQELDEAVQQIADLWDKLEESKIDLAQHLKEVFFFFFFFLLEKSSDESGNFV